MPGSSTFATLATLADQQALLAVVSVPGRGTVMMVAVAVAATAFMLMSGIVRAFVAAFVVAAGMFRELMRAAGVGIVAIIVIVMLIFF